MILTMAGSRTYVGPAYYDSRQPVTVVAIHRLSTRLAFLNRAAFWMAIHPMSPSVLGAV